MASLLPPLDYNRCSVALEAEPMDLMLSTIILAEVIFALVVVVGLLGVVYLRLRRSYRKILEEYQRLRSTIRVKSNLSLQQTSAFDTSDENRDHSLEYFLRSTSSEAKKRYTALTRTKLPRLLPDQPLSAKVAALRYLYLNTEAELLKRGKPPHQSWVILERKLYDAVRWIVNHKQNKRDLRNNQLRLMQKKLNTLKKHETENKELRRKLYLHQMKQQELTAEMAKNQQTVSKLERINTSLQEALIRQAPEGFFQQANLNCTRGENQLLNIRDMSSQKRQLTGELMAQLQSLDSPSTERQRNQMTLVIKDLENNLDSSTRTIINLQKQLDAARSLLEQRAGTDQEEVHVSVQATEQMVAEHRDLAARKQAWAQGTGHEQTLAEIMQLRENNQRQRRIIIELEQELQTLRQAILDDPDSKSSDEQSKKVEHLEKLIKECEYCIDTLESEVDMLQHQLQQGLHAEPSHSLTDHRMQDDAIAQLNHELDRITSKLEHTLAQHKTDSIVRRLAIDTLELSNIEALARRFVITLRELQLAAGFYIDSELGQAEYFPSRVFTTNDKNQIKAGGINAPITYLNEGILFSTKNVHLMLKDPPTDEETQIELEATLAALAALISARVTSLQAQTQVLQQEVQYRRWAADTKALLTNLDIQYANRTETTGRLIKGMLEEIKHIASLVDMTSKTGVLLSNTINECELQLKQLFSNDNVIEQDYDQLLAQLEKLTHLARK